MFRFLLSVVFVFALVVPASGQTTAAEADFDGNGEVDIADFLQFVNAFGQPVETTPVEDSVEGGGIFRSWHFGKKSSSFGF